MNRKHLSLMEKLQAYKTSGMVPFHMPGHKRNTAFAPYLKSLGAEFDISEVFGFDDLHAPEGILKEAMERAARVWKSETTYFLVNGSTGGILAGIRAATQRGDRVLVARNCHKAVYHAVELCGLQPIFLTPPLLEDFGCFGSLPPQEVERALEETPGIRLVILTSPTYEGVISNVAEICRMAHSRGVPVLVDEAHGAHLGFHPAFSGGAVAAGADLVIQSLHKTLPSLTQTAILHRKGSLVSHAETMRQLGIFQTSSPSYLFLASMDACVRLLEEQVEPLFSAWYQRLVDWREAVSQLSHLHILGNGVEHVYALDPSKLVISVGDSGLTGIQLMERLRTRWEIELEMALEPYAIAMTGMGDTLQSLHRLAEGLLELDKEGGQATPWKGKSLPVLRRQVSLDKAVERAWMTVPFEAAAGQVSAEYLWAYPPGIPLITPGEVVEADIIKRLSQSKQEGVNLLGTRAKPPETMAVLRQESFGNNIDNG